MRTQILAREWLGSGADLADVKSIAIGFGLRGNTTTRGGAATVYAAPPHFDDIRVYPCRPGGLITDLNHDCVIDFKDVSILVDSWLEKRLSP